MPSRKFYQPLDERGDLPQRYEQRFVPPKEDGWPDWDAEVLQDVDVIGTEECSGEWLIEVCGRELPEGFSYPELLECGAGVRTCQVGEDLPDLMDTAWIQIRGCNLQECSDWSNATTVPEPSIGLSLMVAILIGVIHERSRRGRRTRGV